MLSPDDAALIVEKIVGRCGNDTVPSARHLAADIKSGRDREAILLVEFPRTFDIVGNVDRDDSQTL